MLKYVTVEYSIKQNIEESQPGGLTCVSLLTEYKNHLVAGGYLCRKKSSIYEDREHQRIYLSGILGSPSALRDAEKEPRVAELLRSIQGCLERDVEVKEFGICQDYWYCEDHEWSGLLLINGRLFGKPSFVCSSCGGLVATYRLKLPWELASDMWSLEREADAINDLTVACGCYEDWSDSQLENVDSALNTSLIIDSSSRP